MLPPCAVPLSLGVHAPSSSTPAANQRWISRTTRLSPMRCSTNRTRSPWLSDPKKSRRSASSTQLIGFFISPWSQRCQRLMGAAPWPRAIRKIDKLGLVHGRQDRHRRSLDDLVFDCRYANRSLLLAVPLGHVYPSHWLRAVGSAPHSVRQLDQARLQPLAILGPRLAVDTRCRITFQLVERRPERVDGIDMVQQRGESHSFLLFGCSPYPPQRRVHTRPTLRSECPGLWPVPLAQPPFLQSLRL